MLLILGDLLNNYKMTTCIDRIETWKPPMLKIFLILVLIFVANVAFASGGLVQSDKNTSIISCNADSEVFCNQDISDIELDFLPPLYSLTIPNYINIKFSLHDALITALSRNFFKIRAPPYY